MKTWHIVAILAAGAAFAGWWFFFRKPAATVTRPPISTAGADPNNPRPLNRAAPPLLGR